MCLGSEAPLSSGNLSQPPLLARVDAAIPFPRCCAWSTRLCVVITGREEAGKALPCAQLGFLAVALEAATSSERQTQGAILHSFLSLQAI